MALVQIDLIQLLVDVVLLIILGMGFIVYKFRNFMVNWWNVKHSNGAKVLVEVENPIQDYFATGTFDNAYLRYVARKRADNPTPNRMISVEDINAVIYSKFGVKCIRVDDAKNTVRPRRSSDEKSIPGYNAEKMDEAVQTALFKPSPLGVGLFDAKTWQIIVLIAFVIVIIVEIVAVASISGVAKNVQSIYGMVQNITLAMPKG